MKYSELSSKTESELSKIYKDSKRELLNLRIQKTTGELEKTHRFSTLKKDIARVLTIINSKKGSDNA